VYARLSNAVGAYGLFSDSQQKTVKDGGSAGTGGINKNCKNYMLRVVRQLRTRGSWVQFLPGALPQRLNRLGSIAASATRLTRYRGSSSSSSASPTPFCGSSFPR